MCFGRSCRLQKLFGTDTDLAEHPFSSVERDVYDRFILAFQLQFGIYEAESERFRWEKEK